MCVYKKYVYKIYVLLTKFLIEYVFLLFFFLPGWIFILNTIIHLFYVGLCREYNKKIKTLLSNPVLQTHKWKVSQVAD